MGDKASGLLAECMVGNRLSTSFSLDRACKDLSVVIIKGRAAFLITWT